MAQLQDNEQFVLSVVAVDSEGNPVADPGTRTWTVDDETIGTLTDNGDGSQTFVTTGKIGTCVVTVQDQEPSADPDTPGALYQGSLAVTVLTGPIQEIVIQAGTPTPRA